MKKCFTSFLFFVLFLLPSLSLADISQNGYTYTYVTSNELSFSPLYGYGSGGAGSCDVYYYDSSGDYMQDLPVDCAAPTLDFTVVGGMDGTQVSWVMSDVANNYLSSPACVSQTLASCQAYSSTYGSSEYDPTPVMPISGCTDPSATNYDPSANIDVGSCSYYTAPIYGCTDPIADNYNNLATADDGSCMYPDATTTPGVYSGPTNEQWLVIMGVMIFLVSFGVWPSLFSPVTKMFD